MFKWQRPIKIINKTTGQEIKNALDDYQDAQTVPNLPEPQTPVYFVTIDSGSIIMGFYLKSSLIDGFFVHRGTNVGDKNYSPKEIVYWSLIPSDHIIH